MSFIATIVVHEAITKREALERVAVVAGTFVQEQNSAEPFVALPDGSRVNIEVPKFGEAPPMAIDVSSTVSIARARVDAAGLQALLEEATQWSIVKNW
jgi:hypothetical protein